jgi:branched-chain amino acid transport system ATP-binding protein
VLHRAAAHKDLDDLAMAAVGRVRLSDFAGRRARTLAHGDQRKLEIAMLIALEPDVYMFDEPTAGMSLEEMPAMLDVIAEIAADRSKTVLLIEHKMDVIRTLASRIIVLTNGRMTADGDPASVVASHAVQRAYLGLAADG